MAKTLSGIADDVIQPFYAFEALFDSQPLRIWTGTGNKTIGGETYIGTGALLSIEGLVEAADLSANNCTVTLSGIPTEVVYYAISEPYQGRVANVYLGLDGVAPIEVFGGYMDVMAIEDGGDSSTISVTIESRLVELERIKPFRYTSESHRSRYSSDTFFSYVSKIQDKKIAWGPQGSTV